MFVVVRHLSPDTHKAVSHCRSLYGPCTEGRAGPLDTPTRSLYRPSVWRTHINGHYIHLIAPAYLLGVDGVGTSPCPPRAARERALLPGN